ncbi:MAG TPA: helix-hairpin-helix domain-containing protein [Fimbriimonadaceae bacterium]|nr:helix-hairpin-helix domain-containing protein [Fimbriimonadaceae bacterium]
MLGEFTVQKVALTVIGLLAVLGIAAFFGPDLGTPPKIEISSSNQASSAPQRLLSTPADPTDQPKEVEPGKLIVHVAGAVASPGVYEFEPGSRVKDALEKAGGSKGEASLDDINLSAKLVDGEQVYIPLKTEDAPAEVAKVAEVYSGARAKASPTKAKATSRALAPKSISLNTATAAELDRLPGVGPSTAAKIIAYRQDHGGFSSIDEVLAVKGIGPKKLAEMRPYLRL